MTFLSAYHTYSSGNEAPQYFHDWAAFAVLSACCGPNLWLDMGIIGNIQPNLYIMYVTPPGIAKSTAKDIAKRLLHKISTSKHPIPIAPESASKEAFIKHMSDEKSPCRMVFEVNKKACKYTKCIILSDEFVNLVQVGGDPLGWVQLLTQIYNPQVSFESALISRGMTELPYPYITLLGCMTPDLTKSLINENALSGGFSRRVIYLYANKGGPPIPRPVKTDAQREAEAFLVERGRQIQALSGSFSLTDSATRLYDTWYISNYEAKKGSVSAAEANFLQSKSQQILKVAMLARLSYSDELVIDDDDFVLAEALVTNAQQHINTIFAGIGRNPHAATMAGIQMFIKIQCESSPHYVTRKKVYGNFLNHASQKDIDTLIDQMTNIDQIKQVSMKFDNGQVLSALTTPEYFMSFKKKE